ncbi:LacI family DNA-binding transcriptional regulator [Arthrobacter sp. SA17]
MSHEIEAMILSMGNEGSAHRRAGIVDVAKVAGVSRQTVTRAMNDMPGISETTKSRVLDAAKALRYRPSRYGRGLVKKGTPILGLVVYDLTNTFYAEMASSVVEAASKHGWTVLVTEWARGGDQILVELAQQVDGIFSEPCRC